MYRAIAGLAALLIASPATAQVQYWLPNGPGGTTYNNPQGSLSGTYYEHALQRYADQHRWARQRQQQTDVPYGNAPSGAAASLDPSFRVSNAGGRTIREIYVSPATSTAWGPDRLGSAVLAPGQRLAIPLPMGQCVNDVRVVFMDGRADERRQVNTCALTDMAFR